MPLWKWTFYGGTVLLMAALLSKALGAYESFSAPVRVLTNVVGVLGQISLPVFVCHNLVLRVKGLLVHAPGLVPVRAAERAAAQPRVVS